VIDPQELYDDYLRWCGTMKINRILTKQICVAGFWNPGSVSDFRKGTGFCDP
jgi:hypothetical protein